MRLPLLLLLLLPMAACATTTEAPASTEKAADYVPLAIGNRWSYRVVPGPAEPQELRIVEQDKDGFYVDSAGGRFAPRSDGVFDGRRFVLQEPVVANHSWSARPKDEALERFKIVATGAEVTVPAGTFSSCVQVEGEQVRLDPDSGKPATLLISWTYAKDVGLIRVEQRVQRQGEEAVTMAVMELVSFELAAK